MIWHHPEIAGRTYGVSAPFPSIYHLAFTSLRPTDPAWDAVLSVVSDNRYYRHCRIGKITIKGRA